MPGGQFSIRAPHRWAIGLFVPAKFEIHTLSSPSTTTAHGPGKLLPVNDEPSNGLPSGLSKLTLPPPNRPPCCSCMRRVSSGSGLRPIFIATPTFASDSAPCGELPKRFVTHTLPRLSIASPLPL